MGPRIEETELEDRRERDVLKRIDHNVAQACWLLLSVLVALGGIFVAILTTAPK